MFLPKFLFFDSENYTNNKNTINSVISLKSDFKKHILNHSNKCEICNVTKNNVNVDNIEQLLDNHYLVKNLILNIESFRLMTDLTCSI